MQTLKRNRRKFFYLLYQGKTPVIEDGYETGETRVLYSDAVQMDANISAASGQAQIEQFGILDTYDKVIVTADMKCPIDENSVLFVDKLPEYDESGNPMYDYIVKRVAKSINGISYLISKVKVS